MCMNTMTGADLYHLTPGKNFWIQSYDVRYQATKIESYNSYCLVDIPEFGETGEGLMIFFDDIEDDGTFILQEPFGFQCKLKEHNGS